MSECLARCPTRSYALTDEGQGAQEIQVRSPLLSWHLLLLDVRHAPIPPVVQSHRHSPLREAVRRTQSPRRRPPPRLRQLALWKVLRSAEPRGHFGHGARRPCAALRGSRPQSSPFPQGKIAAATTALSVSLNLTESSLRGVHVLDATLRRSSPQEPVRSLPVRLLSFPQT